MKFTRAEVEQAIEDCENAIVEKRQEIAEEERSLADLRAQLDGYCRATCDHGGGCNLPRHHEPPDRHESAHCVFYDTQGGLTSAQRYLRDEAARIEAKRSAPPDAKCATCGGAKLVEGKNIPRLDDPQWWPCPDCGGTGRAGGGG